MNVIRSREKGKWPSKENKGLDFRGSPTDITMHIANIVNVMESFLHLPAKLLVNYFVFSNGSTNRLQGNEPENSPNHVGSIQFWNHLALQCY